MCHQLLPLFLSGSTSFQGKAEMVCAFPHHHWEKPQSWPAGPSSGCTRLSKSSRISKEANLADEPHSMFSIQHIRNQVGGAGVVGRKTL